MTSCDVFRGKSSRVFHFLWRPFLLFTLAICDLLTPSFRLCWSLLHFADDSVWTIVDRQNLNLQFKRSVLCRFCEGESVSIQEVERVSLWAVGSFNCNNPDCSSHVLNNSFHTTPKRNRFYYLNRGLRVKTSPSNLQKGKLGYWTESLQRQFIGIDNNNCNIYKIVHINTTSTYPCLNLLFWIDRCRCRHRRSHCSFSFFWTFSLARHFGNKSEKFKWITRATTFPQHP